MLRDSGLDDSALSFDKKHDSFEFQFRRWFTYIINALNNLLVYVQRTSATSLCSYIAKSYGVKSDELGFWSAIFFFPHAIIQPFAGLIADVMEPAFLIGGSTILSGLGAAITGASRTVGVGAVGRFIVGLSSGVVFGPCCRSFANWFPLSWYAVVAGGFEMLAGSGGFLATMPIERLAHTIGWQWCFYGLAIMGGALGLVTMFFTRGHPCSNGFPPVDAPPQKAEGTAKENLKTLAGNFLEISKNGSFWITTIATVLVCGGPYTAFSGYWAGPYLQYVYGYKPERVAKALISMSLTTMFGSFIMPVLSEVFKSRKWVIIAGIFVGMAGLAPFLIWEGELPFWAICMCFVAFALGTVALCPVFYAHARQLFGPKISAAVIGFINFFTFLSGSIYQLIEGGIIHAIHGEYKVQYRYGLILLSMVSMGLGALIFAFGPDSYGGSKKVSTLESTQLLQD